jgi:hypothetical protein
MHRTWRQPDVASRADRSCVSVSAVSSDFRLPWRFVFDAKSVIGSLHSMDVGSVADVSEIHAASIFRA